MFQTRTVAVNESGRRIGEDQTGAKLTNHDVDQLWQLHEQGLGYKRLARVFEISRSHVRNIVKGKRRGQTIARWKVVHCE
jgi:Mor family transcriptional regulator